MHIVMSQLACGNISAMLLAGSPDVACASRMPQVRFYYSFASKDNLYIVMEYIAGGDLYSLLRNLGALDEDVARTYIAETVLALEYCHTQVNLLAFIAEHSAARICWEPSAG